MTPKALRILTALLRVLINARCRTQADADRLNRMLDEFESEMRT